MTINLNNRAENFEYEELTVSKLLKVKGYTFHALVIKLNGQLIKKPQYDEAKVIDGDKVDVIHLISGG